MWAEVYVDNAGELIDLAGGLTEEQLSSVVPATPEWTVREVLQHLAGGPADILAGRLDGVPGPSWTGRHVSERTGRSVAELCDEIEANRDALAAGPAEDHPASVWDIAVHYTDLREALGLGRSDERLWRPIYEAAKGRIPESVRAADSVDDYERFRAVFSRRSQAQVAAWNTGAGEEELAGMYIFGPRDDDQPIPE